MKALADLTEALDITSPTFAAAAARFVDALNATSSPTVVKARAVRRLSDAYMGVKVMPADAETLTLETTLRAALADVSEAQAAWIVATIMDGTIMGSYNDLGETAFDAVSKINSTERGSS